MITIFKGLEAFQSVYRQGCNANPPPVTEMADWFEERRTGVTNQVTNQSTT